MKKPHILIVEDEYFIYEDFRYVLLEESYTVADFAPSVAEAEKEIQIQRPDLVLLDIDLLGEETGIDLGKKLLNKYHIPFIYITSLDDRHTFSEALKTEHEIFMVKTKPVIDYKILLRHVETVLNKNRQPTKELKPKTLGITALANYLDESKSNGKEQISNVKICFDDIVFISKDKFVNNSGKKEILRHNYVWLKIKQGQIYFLKSSLTQIQDSLPDNFSRISSKYIINITSPDFIGQTKGNVIKLKDRNLILTRSFKESFEKKLEKYFPSFK